MSGMLTVGITGRSGSGKSSVAARYAALGHTVADGDAISREVCAPGTPCLAQLALAFGGGILRADGSLDRKKLGAMAFADERANQRLVDITHPYIIEAFLARGRQAREAGAKLFFADGAVIVGGPFEPYCDRLIVVTAPQGVSVERIMRRDKIDEAAAHRRLAAQLGEDVLVAAADYVIENDADEETLRRRADAVLERLLDEVSEREG